MSAHEPNGHQEPSIQELQSRLEEAQATIRALTSSNVDAVLDVEHGHAVLLKEAQEALRASEELHRLVLESITDAVFLTGEDGRFVYICPNVSRIFGYSLDEVEAQGAIAALLGADLIKGRVFNEGGELRNIEHSIIAKDGAKRDLLVYIRKVDIRDAAYLYVCHDNTERNHLYQQLIHAQKMEAIGQLSAGVAHDFNNLMTVVTGYGELLLHKLRPEDPIRKHIDSMVQAGCRAAILTRKLLAFGRKQVLRTELASLNAIVEGMKEMLSRTVFESIEIQYRLDPKTGLVNVDKNQLEQVIMNLAVNARDAMPGGGLMTFRTQNIHLTKEYAAQLVEVSPGDYVMLEVSDTGTGIDKEVLGRIFEPFFTTKPFGKGTGLGLSTCMGFVKQSGGHISVYSEVGRGTTFKIYLPRAEDATHKGASSDSTLPAVAQGSETVLIVEDEPELLTLAQTMLEQCGYKVLTAPRGAMAIKLAAEYEDTIHLLLSDMVLPAMNGRELADLLRSSRPDIKIVFMSGYTNDVLIHQGTLPKDMAFLEKPFTLQTLAQKIRETLDG